MKRGKRICNTLKDVRIQFTNGSVTEYVYSATGQKLGVEYRVAAPNTTVTFGVEPDALTLGQTVYAGSTQYLLGGSLVMKDGLTDRYLFDGGYAKASAVNPTAYSFEFHYYNRDHLGNIREVVDSAGVVEQVTNYYPFGTPYTQSAAVMNANMQPYKFNGKELDDETGLYYYGARYYDPKLSVWYSTDRYTEKYPFASPYNYALNNPMKYVDLHGDTINWALNYSSYMTKFKVNKLREQSIVFNTLYKILDSSPTMYNLSADDKIVQEAFKGQSNWIYNNAKGYAYGNTVVFSEIYADINTFCEEI